MLILEPTLLRMVAANSTSMFTKGIRWEKCSTTVQRSYYLINYCHSKYVTTPKFYSFIQCQMVYGNGDLEKSFNGYVKFSSFLLGNDKLLGRICELLQLYNFRKHARAMLYLYNVVSCICTWLDHITFHV